MNTKLFTFALCTVIVFPKIAFAKNNEDAIKVYFDEEKTQYILDCILQDSDVNSSNQIYEQDINFILIDSYPDIEINLPDKKMVYESSILQLYVYVRDNTVQQESVNFDSEALIVHIK